MNTVKQNKTKQNKTKQMNKFWYNVKKKKENKNQSKK